ncbi:hypothetical protein BG011_000808 [Mortierella polycephala]|uniref:Cyclin-like domain-containing protein n=1 Tax=Mortierella polycephala TaxID=41804 RepID=A0A9P6PI02_9FUNG|nr:hypothetical protein BG011_000808 [Mortierella polycephala]
MITASENTNGIASETTPTTTISTTASTVDANDVNGTSQTTTTGNANEAMKEITMKQLYEQSTQYKYWRFTQSALDDMRNKLNDEVIASIKEGDNVPEDFEFVNVAEELALMGYYERRIVQIFKHWKLPSYVSATAIAYMKRFFLENTMVDYHPKDVMLTCMFLARKTENYLLAIEDFSSVLKSPAQPILNLEFLVCKSLRFHFTVHHPYRPCLGFFYDMQAVADSIEKLQKVYEKALTLIDTSLHTDLGFLYQPSQIALAALKMACKEESYDFEKYANYKFKSNESTSQKYNETLFPILKAIEKALTEDPRCHEGDKLALKDIDQRLKKCTELANSPSNLSKRKRIEPNGDDDDDDDDDERLDKRAKTDNDNSE